MEVTGCAARDDGAAGALRCVRKDGRCGYHRSGQPFTRANLLPEGLCPAAGHALYPATLALLFEAAPENVPETVYCPGTDAWVVFRRVFEPAGIRHRLLNLAKLAVRPFMRAQRYAGALCWEVDAAHGPCPNGHAVGQRFRIDKGGLHVAGNLVLPLGDRPTACPALFHSLFAFRALGRAGRGPSGAGGRFRAVCPDHRVNITLEEAGRGG